MKDAIGSFMFMFIIVIALLICSFFETTYTQTARVIEVKSEYVIVETDNGQKWRVQDDTLTYDDKVELLIYDNHTIDNRKDDTIKRIKKIK